MINILTRGHTAHCGETKQHIGLVNVQYRDWIRQEEKNLFSLIVFSFPAFDQHQKKGLSKALSTVSALGECYFY